MLVFQLEHNQQPVVTMLRTLVPVACGLKLLLLLQVIEETNENETLPVMMAGHQLRTCQVLDVVVIGLRFLQAQ